MSAWAAGQAWLTSFTVTRPSTSSPDTQITLNFNLNQPVSYKAFTLSHPHRLVVDLQNTKYAFSDVRTVNLSGTDITDFRHGIREGYNLRMVFDLKEAMRFSLEAHHDKNFQVLVTLSPGDIILPSPIKSEKQEVIQEAMPASNAIQESKPIKKTEKHKFIVVIDAGHGGKDPGAEGPGGTKKKISLLPLQEICEH